MQLYYACSCCSYVCSWYWFMQPNLLWIRIGCGTPFIKKKKKNRRKGYGFSGVGAEQLPNRTSGYVVLPPGATAIERWTPCSFKKTRKKGRFSRTGDVRAYSGKGIKIAEIWKKGYTFQQLRYAFRVYILLIMKRDENTHFDTRLGYVWPQKNGTVDFLGLCSDQQLSFFTLLDRTYFPHYNNTKIIKIGWKFFILWVISYGLSFSGFAINFSLVSGPPKNGTVNFLGLCSKWTVIFFTLLDRASFPNYNDTKIIKFGWKLFILWVISYRLSFWGIAINLSSCLETLEIGQITKMTVHKKCLIK